MCNIFKYFSYFRSIQMREPICRWFHFTSKTALLLESIKFAFIILDGGIDLGQIHKN